MPHYCSGISRGFSFALMNLFGLPQSMTKTQYPPVQNNPSQTLPFSGRKNALPCRIKEKRIFGLCLEKRLRMNADEIVSQGGQICSLNGKTG